MFESDIARLDPIISFLLERVIMKSYNKIGIILIIIATILSVVLIPYMDSKIADLEKDVIFLKDAIADNIFAYLQNIIIENRIEIMFARYDLREINKKEILFEKIITQYIYLAKAYLGWWDRGERELEILMEELKEKIEAVNNSNKKRDEKINAIHAILMNEKDKAFDRMGDMQNNLKGLQNNLIQKQLNRDNLYFTFSFFQIFGLLLVSLKSILK